MSKKRRRSAAAKTTSKKDPEVEIDMDAILGQFDPGSVDNTGMPFPGDPDDDVLDEDTSESDGFVLPPSIEDSNEDALDPPPAKAASSHKKASGKKQTEINKDDKSAEADDSVKAADTVSTGKKTSEPVEKADAPKSSRASAKDAIFADAKARAEARAEARRSVEHSGKKPSAFDKLKSIFSRAEKDASVDKETGEPSRAKKVFAFMATHTIVNRVKDGWNSIKGGTLGVVDGIAERHGRARFETLLRRYSDDDILKAASAIKKSDPAAEEREALDTVHKYGYLTAGGKDYVEDVKMLEQLRAKGHTTGISQAMPNVYVPDQLADKLDIGVQVNAYHGNPSVAPRPVEAQPETVTAEAPKAIPIEPKQPVSSIGSDIRSKLNESATDGKIVLDKEVEESMKAYVQIEEGLKKLQEIADRDDLPESYKSFMRTFGPRLNDIINEQDNATRASLSKVMPFDQDEHVESDKTATAPVQEQPVADPKKVAMAQQVLSEVGGYDDGYDEELAAQFDD